MRRLLRRKRDEVTREWRKLHNEKLNDLYSSPNIGRVIKSGMRWVEDVACMGYRRGVYSVLVGKTEGKRPLGRTRRRWGIIISWTLRKWDVGAWSGSIWFHKMQGIS
jgi:hypothetical protein